MFRDWLAWRKHRREIKHIERIIAYGKLKKAKQEKEK